MQKDFQTWIRTMDRRKFCRVRVSAKAKLFAPDQGGEIDCMVTMLSRGGAGIRCKAPPQAGSQVALYVDGFGRFDGVTTKPSKDGIGMRFAYTSRKRQRIIEQLTVFLAKGLGNGASVRRYDSFVLKTSDRPLPVIDDMEITPEMLIAGEAAALVWDASNRLTPDVLKAVYLAMARLDRRAPPSDDQSTVLDDCPASLRVGT